MAKGMKPLHRWKRRLPWIIGVPVVVLAGLLLVAVWDFRAIQHHATEGPFEFQPQPCAGTPLGTAARNTIPTSVGLSAWTTFEGSASHNMAVVAHGFHASWQFETGGSVVSAPAVVNGVVYAGSMDGCVYALNAASGQLIWSFAADNQVMSEPLVADGNVFVTSGNKVFVVTSTGLIRGSGANTLYVLNAQTGAEIGSVPLVGTGMPTPVYSNGVVYEATGGQEFYAVSATTGQLLWQLPDGVYASMSSPIVVGNTVILGGADPYELLGINDQTHTIAWTVPLPKASGGVDDLSPTASGNVVYAQVPEGTVFPHIIEFAVDATTGQILWQTTLGVDYHNLLQRALRQGYVAAYDGEEVGIATVVGNHLYVGTPGIPDLWELDAQTGAVIWRKALPEAVRSSPTIVGTTLYAVGRNRLLVLNATTGQLLKSSHYNDFVEGSGAMIECTTASPEVIGQTLFLEGGYNGYSVIATPLDAAP